MPQAAGKNAVRFGGLLFGQCSVGERHGKAVVVDAGHARRIAGGSACGFGPFKALHDGRTGHGQSFGTVGAAFGVGFGPAKGGLVNELRGPEAQRRERGFVQRTARRLIRGVGAVKHGGLLLLRPSA